MVKRGQCAVLIALGLLIGIVFGVFSPRWYAPIAREDAIAETLQFESWTQLHNRRGSSAGAKLTFSNGEARFIDESCENDAVFEKLNALQSGETIDLLTHPDGTILSLNAAGETILDFDFTQQKLERKGKQFTYIGAFGFFCAGVGIVNIIRKKPMRRR